MIFRKILTHLNTILDAGCSIHEWRFHSGQGLSGLVDWGLTGRRYQGNAPDDRE
ncbi:MAG: hypothetical protein ACW990_17275 [Promethearchaeota archaeon]